MVGRLRAPFFLPMIARALLSAFLMLPSGSAPKASEATASVGLREGPLGAASSLRAFLPDTVLTPPGGPAIVFLTSPSPGVTALRLSVPFVEGPTEAGAERLLELLARERMRGLAAPVGARVWSSRTPWGIAYTVEGAEADFEYLAYLLRQAVAEPRVEDPSFTRARRRLEEELARSRETPGAAIEAMLRRRIEPEAPPPGGTEVSLAALDAARTLEVWRRSHQASGMTLVVATSLPAEVVLAATRGVGAPEEDAAPPLDAPLPAPRTSSRPETLRSWLGLGYRMGPPTDPATAVVAKLLADRLRTVVRGYEARVELWEAADAHILAITGAGYRRARGAMRRTLGNLVPQARRELDAERVRRAVARVRRDLLFGARTPAGLVAAVGRARDATGEPQAAAGYLSSLESVGVIQVRAVLEAMTEQPPIRVEIEP